MKATIVPVTSPNIERRTKTTRLPGSTTCGLIAFLICFGALSPGKAIAQPHNNAWSDDQRFYQWVDSFFDPDASDREKMTDDYITAEENKYNAGLGYSTVGQIYENGSALTLVVPSSAPLTTVTLTFGWANPSTGAPVFGGPAIASVQYYAFVGTPSTGISTNLNDTLIWSLVGDSTDSSSGFLDNYVFVTSEQILVAQALDSSGNPISLGGVDGYNAALSDASIVVSVPEPNTLTLLGIGAI